MDNSIEQKQVFLRKEILEAGYDGNDFMTFLTLTNYHKGSDLNLWTIRELTNVVMTFKQSKANQKQPAKADKVQVVSISEETEEKIKMQDDSTYIQKIQCQTKQVNSIFQKCEQLVIKLTKFDKIEGGIFERNYITYEIQVPSLNTIVNRRYSQFAWMRDTLMQLYPGFPVPPVAKKSNVIRYEEKYLQKKMYILQKFLNTIARIPELCSDVVFERFLTIGEPKQWQKFKALHSKIPVIPIRKVKKLEGFITIGTEKKMTTKLSKYNEFLKQTQPEIKKIYKNFKGVATNLQIASDFLKGVMFSCQHLRKKEDAIRAELELPSIAQNSNLFVLQQLAQSYSTQLLTHSKSFRKQIYSLAKYQSLYRINMIEAIKQLKLKEQEYLQVKAKLLKTKQKLYAEGKVSKWGLKGKDPVKPNTKQQSFAIMLPKETSELLSQRQIYGLYNAQIYEECYNHTRDFNKNILNYMRQFLQLQLKISFDTWQGFDKVVANIKKVEEALHSNI